ncbi:MAG TPA: hypothetical protein VK402_22665 [Blastococcus sp.]|nr:hypothetical protein [Blastococcus sp.]
MATIAAPAADASPSWSLLIVGGFGLWTAVAGMLGVVLGRAIRRADLRETSVAVSGVLTTADLPRSFRAEPVRRRPSS